MEKLVQDILSKKELSNLSEKIVFEFLEKFFKENPSVKKKLQEKKFNEKSKEYKDTVKEIRRKLREIYGVFVKKDFSKREKLLEKLSDKNEKEIITQLLKQHQSSDERFAYYEDIYDRIFATTGKPNIILDLACGLNPLSYSFLGCKPEYIASDISKGDLEFIDLFFKKSDINGKTIEIDLVNENDKVKDFKVDVCFLFKALDSLETRKKDISKSLLDKINAKWIIVSFSKISIGGSKRISKNRRNWVLDFVEKKGWYHEEFEVPNEYFLVVKKF